MLGRRVFTRRYAEVDLVALAGVRFEGEIFHLGLLGQFR
jgi:hypothetical protein